MAVANVADFRAAVARKRKTKEVEIEGLGTIRLRSLSAGDAQRFQADVKQCVADGKDPEALSFPLIARSWVGEDDQLWLPEEQGIELAKSLDPDTYNQIATAVLELNGLPATAEAVAEKNSEASRTESTLTGSPENSATPT